MIVDVPKGTYIVAVSGGVDSMCLLDMLRRRPELRLIVAHADHGLRNDSDKDEKLVRSYAMSHNIEFVSRRLHLEKTSEEAARRARYAFLRQVRKIYKADAIITAHHQDDLLETAILNLLRGTGWRGIAPFASANDIIRPLLEVSKKQLVTYAKKHAVPWREDVSNSDLAYTRNAIRHTILPKLNADSNTREHLLQLIRKQQQLRRTITTELHNALLSNIRTNNNQFQARRYWLIMLPHHIAYELFQLFCAEQCGNTILRRQAEDAILFIKVARQGKIMALGNGWRLRMKLQTFIVEPVPSW